MNHRSLPDGITIAVLREAQHLSTSELARRAGLSRQYMSRIQRGDRGASGDALTRIAKALGVPVASITLRERESVAS